MTVRSNTDGKRPGRRPRRRTWTILAAVAVLASAVLPGPVPAADEMFGARKAAPVGKRSPKSFGGARQAPAPADPANEPVAADPVDAAALSPEANSLPPAPATAVTDDGNDSIVLNFENADIREVIYSLAVAMDVNYWVDPRVQGQVTVRTSGRLSRSDLWPIFHQLLRNNGFAAIKNGDLYSIIPAEEAKTRVIVPDGAGARDNHFVMNVVKVRHVSAEQMAETVTPFISPGGDLVSFPRSNLIIVTDVARNANRLAELIETFDTNTFAEMNAKIFKVENAILEDLAVELESILEAYHVAETGSPAVLLPLSRLGAIAVIATDRALIMAVDYWISVLDVKAEQGGRRQVYVYRVENSKAVDLAAVLSEVYGDGGRSTSSRRSRSGEAAEAGLGLGGGLANSRGRSNSRDSGSSSSVGSSRGGGLGSSRSSNSRSSRNDRSGRSGGRSSGGGGGVILGGTDSQSDIFEQEVRVVEDEVTNSLVVLSTPRDYETLRTVLRSLDVVPRQVLFEALIAEINLNEGDSLSIMQALQGVEQEGTTGKTGDQGGTYLDMFGDELRLIGAIGSGGLLGTLSAYRNGIEIYKGVIEASANEGRAKILSRPNLMTSDNQEARLLVGQEVPILTQQSGSNVQANATTQIVQSVQYRDTGLVIRALPQVNSEGLVNLELSLEISEVASGVSAGGIQSPTFTTREAETSVVVNSGETLIIGGIIAETTAEEMEGVPYLMNLPVLGPMFRSTNSTRRRVELIVLITPFVVRDRDEARSVTEDFRRRVDGVLKDVELIEARDPASHTLILEAPGGPTTPPPAPESTRKPVPQPDGGPIPLDFRETRS